MIRKNCIYCSGFGALVELDHYGRGYLPDEYESDRICPECAEKLGFDITVNVE